MELNIKRQCYHSIYVLVEIVWDPLWDQDMMSEAAKLKLGML